MKQIMKKYCSPVNIKLKNFKTKFQDKISRQKTALYRQCQNPTYCLVNSLKCNICQSINYLAPKCTDKNSSHDTHITLYQSNKNSYNCFKRFTGEFFGAAILGSGASKAVCGRTWIDCYSESLSWKEKELIKHPDSKNIFKFGDGIKVKSL